MYSYIYIYVNRVFDTRKYANAYTLIKIDIIINILVYFINNSLTHLSDN